MFIKWKKWWLGVEPIPTTSLLRQGTLIDSFITIKPHGRAFVMVSTWDVYKHSFFCQHMNCTVVLYTNTVVLLENGCTPFNPMPFPSTTVCKNDTVVFTRIKWKKKCSYNGKSGGWESNPYPPPRYLGKAHL
jgi:hypothetical protein